MVFVRAFASVFNCRWSSADSVSQRRLQIKLFLGRLLHGVGGTKADLCEQRYCSVSCQSSDVRNTLTRPWINTLACGDRNPSINDKRKF